MKNERELKKFRALLQRALSCLPPEEPGARMRDRPGAVKRNLHRFLVRIGSAPAREAARMRQLIDEVARARHGSKPGGGRFSY